LEVLRKVRNVSRLGSHLFKNQYRHRKALFKAYEEKFYKDCDCPIRLTGSTGTERYPRQALGVRDWHAAEAKLRSLNAGAKDETVHGLELRRITRSGRDSGTEARERQQVEAGPAFDVGCARQ
jgi:hypothetical protein